MASKGKFTVIDLHLNRPDRERAWQALTHEFEHFFANSRPLFDEETRNLVLQKLVAWDFSQQVDLGEIIKYVNQALKSELNTSSTVYFGVFNPSASVAGILAECLAALYNPQLASTMSAPFAIAVEQKLIDFFGGQFNFLQTRGHFTSGGTEANLTAMLCALNRKITNIKVTGIGEHRPTVYVSTETHHSFLRAASVCGIGHRAVREIPVDATLKMNVNKLKAQILSDQQQGFIPTMIVANLGSTSSGIFDDIQSLVEVAKEFGCWIHGDGAWGGPAILLDEYQSVFKGAEQLDSLTIDAHKWLSVPMGAGMFLTRHEQILQSTFATEDNPYMPNSAELNKESQPYAQSLQWSRRFIGLKLFMTLANVGISGYQNILRHQIDVGQYLRKKLQKDGWNICNETPFPVVLFYDTGLQEKGILAQTFLESFTALKKCWITSTDQVFTKQKVLRAGIPNFATQNSDIDFLCIELSALRQSFLDCPDF